MRIAVLHDINQAGRFAHHLIAMRDGQILAQGPPADVITRRSSPRPSASPA
jgi:ABC-type cobalamin/Fe3+-siderophores transport system ATPase subunit